MNGWRRFVQCLPAHAADEQVADHPELAHGRGIGERIGNGLSIRDEVPDERADDVPDAATRSHADAGGELKRCCAEPSYFTRRSTSGR